MTDTPRENPPQVQESRKLIEQGERLDSRETRRYWCRECGRQVEAEAMPRGWYSLARHTGDYQRPPLRLGLYCSMACLIKQTPAMAAIEEQSGDRFDYSPYQHQPAKPRP